MYYVALDIGCIECGEATRILGIFTSQKKAEKIVEIHRKRQKKQWVGEHDIYVQEIEKLDTEYPVLDYYRND